MSKNVEEMYFEKVPDLIYNDDCLFKKCKNFYDYFKDYHNEEANLWYFFSKVFDNDFCECKYANDKFYKKLKKNNMRLERHLLILSFLESYYRKSFEFKKSGSITKDFYYYLRSGQFDTLISSLSLDLSSCISGAFSQRNFKVWYNNVRIVLKTNNDESDPLHELLSMMIGDEKTLASYFNSEYKYLDIAWASIFNYIIKARLGEPINYDKISLPSFDGKNCYPLEKLVYFYSNENIDYIIKNVDIGKVFKSFLSVIYYDTNKHQMIYEDNFCELLVYKRKIGLAIMYASNFLPDLAVEKISNIIYYIEEPCEDFGKLLSKTPLSKYQFVIVEKAIDIIVKENINDYIDNGRYMQICDKKFNSLYWYSLMNIPEKTRVNSFLKTARRIIFDFMSFEQDFFYNYCKKILETYKDYFSASNFVEYDSWNYLIAALQANEVYKDQNTQQNRKKVIDSTIDLFSMKYGWMNFSNSFEIDKDSLDLIIKVGKNNIPQLANSLLKCMIEEESYQDVYMVVSLLANSGKNLIRFFDNKEVVVQMLKEVRKANKHRLLEEY